MCSRDVSRICWTFFGRCVAACAVLLTLVLLAPSLAFAQPSAQPVCDIVSETDAAAILGSVHKKQSILGPDHCVFTAEGVSLAISRLPDQEPEQVRMLLQLPRQRARAGDVVSDESGIGQGATSELSKGHVAIIAASGDTVWTFGVDHVYRKDLAEMLPKLRELARKVVAHPGDWH